MPDKFKAIVIDQQSEKFTREIKELDVSFLDQGDVLVKVDYSDLNYKDALILNDGGKIVRDFPRIPGIDFSGKVLESNDNEFKKDDEVILTGSRVVEIQTTRLLLLHQRGWILIPRMSPSYWFPMAGRFGLSMVLRDHLLELTQNGQTR